MHRNPETLTTFFSSGMKHLLPSWLLGFRHEERETQFLLCWLFHLTPPRAAHLVDPVLAEAQKSTHFAQVGISTNCFFSKITQNPQSIASGQDVIYIPKIISYSGFLLWQLWLSHPPRVSVNTCAQCVLPPVH